jgi:hypothetical protein
MKSPENPKSEKHFNVLNFTKYRREAVSPRKSPPRTKQNQISKSDRLLDRINSNLIESTPLLSMATIFVSTNGRLFVDAAGIDSVLAPEIAAELERLAAIIRCNASKRKTQSGRASMLALVALAFTVAIYANEIAWLDAVLTLLAEAAMVILTRLQTKQTHQ